MTRLALSWAVPGPSPTVSRFIRCSIRGPQYAQATQEPRVGLMRPYASIPIPRPKHTLRGPRRANLFVGHGDLAGPCFVPPNYGFPNSQRSKIIVKLFRPVAVSRARQSEQQPACLRLLPPQLKHNRSDFNEVSRRVCGYLVSGCVVRSRGFVTSSGAPCHLWLAQAPGPPPLWRRLMGWGPTDNAGSLWKVRARQTTAVVEDLALGGCSMLAILGGRLFGAPVGMGDPAETASAERASTGVADTVELAEIHMEPPEAGGVELGALKRHLSTSAARGIPTALRKTFTLSSQQQRKGVEEEQFVKVAAGLHHCAALTSHGVLYTWGRGGQWGAGSPLGHGDSTDRPRPTIVNQVTHQCDCDVAQFISSGEFVVDVACGAANTCVVTSEAVCRLSACTSGLRGGTYYLWISVSSLGSGRVFSTGAADFGLNGSGMLVSSKVFKELESFRQFLAPDVFAYQCRNEESHLRELEAIRKRLDSEGAPSSLGPLKPFATAQGTSQNTPRNNAGDATTRSHTSGDPRVLPKLACGPHHCALLTADGALWLWGRNDCLQLSQEKPVMASGCESNYPLLADCFARADVRLESCVLGPSHSLAVARNGMVYEWGGTESAPIHPVDLHWSYPKSIFKNRVTKVAVGGYSTSTGFSAALTGERMRATSGKGELFVWGPGASMLPLAVKAADSQTPVRINTSLLDGEAEDHNGKETKVIDVAGGPQGCLIMTLDA